MSTVPKAVATAQANAKQNKENALSVQLADLGKPVEGVGELIRPRLQRAGGRD